jgi:endonuclease/exonuclease/phosphatase family metal-dependent hydrolase
MDPVNLVSYNVHCFPWTAPAIHDIVNWIIANSDIVALQEIWCRHAEWSAAFAAHGWTFARPAREHHIATLFGSGLAIAWNSQKWQLTDTSTRFYPFVDSTGLDQLVSKGWFRIELYQKQSQKKRTLRLINTHMQSDYDIYHQEFRHITEAVRRRQVAQLVAIEHHTVPNLPTLVVGDMNTERCWFPTDWLRTASAITFPSLGTSLDHCTTLGLTQWAIEDFRVSQLKFSDHYPVMWRLSF